MIRGPRQPRLHGRLIDALHAEAMQLAGDARAYFDGDGRADADRAGLDPVTRVMFSCESLKVTTRLLHVIAWLFTQRAMRAGEISPDDALDPASRLGTAPVTDHSLLDLLPEQARRLIEASANLHRRVARLDEAQDAPPPAASPVSTMQRMLGDALARRPVRLQR